MLEGAPCIGEGSGDRLKSRAAFSGGHGGGGGRKSPRSPGEKEFLGAFITTKMVLKSKKQKKHQEAHGPHRSPEKSNI